MCVCLDAFYFSSINFTVFIEHLLSAGCGTSALCMYAHACTVFSWHLNKKGPPAFLTHTTKLRLGTGVPFLPVNPVMEDAAHLLLGWNFIP